MPPSAHEPHRHRETAESFGTDAERYDRTRPRYPDALVGRILAALPGLDVLDVLDVGCGTGIAARQFQALGCRVLGVEPDARMADLARQTGVESEAATFEAWDPAGREFDAVVAGTAWHWVDPVAGAAKAGQVLRPGGRLAPFWHVPQLPPGVAKAVADVCERVMPDSPFNFRAALTKSAVDLHQTQFTRSADGIRQAGGFGDPEQWRFDWECSYTRDEWLEQMPTLGASTRLPPDQLAEVLDGVGTAIDRMGGSFTMPYATMAVTATRSALRARPDGA
ncbi:class I SAM-dependent DNA methyltransferase [Streptacidiphilus sp. PAMC 29251]